MKKQGRNLRFTLLAAVSLDGRITRGNKEGSDWTSREDHQWFQKKLDDFDVIVMGRKTFEVIKRPLKPRNRIVFTQTQLFCCSQEHQHNRCTTAFFGGAGKLRKLLASQNWTRIAVLGGAQIYDWFLKRNLISEMYLTLEPVVFGSGRPLASVSPHKSPAFRLVSVKRLNRQGTLLLHYRHYKRSI